MGENTNTNATENEVLTSSQLLAEDSLNAITVRINSTMDGMQYSMYDIAGLLFEASKFIKDSKYKSLGAYAEDNFGIKKARASQLKTVAERFLTLKEDENGTHYECNLDSDGRPWTADALYFLSTKYDSNDDIKALIESGAIRSTLSNKALIEAVTPKKEIPAKENTAKENTATENTAKENTATENTATENTATDNTAKENTAKEKELNALYEIKQLAEMVKSVFEKHKTSAVVKSTENAIDEIIKLATR